MSPEYLLTTLIVVLAPGAGVMYTLSIGLTDGARASIAAAAGCTLGILPSLIAAVTGLAAVLHTSALVFQIIKVLGVLYLLYMAWRTLRDTTPLTVETSSAPRHSMMRTAATGTLLNILNPKLSLFFLAFLPQFVSASGPAAVIEMLMLGAIFMLVTLVIFIGYGCGAAWLRRHVVDRPSVQAWMRRSLAGVFVLLGARLAVSER